MKHLKIFIKKATDLKKIKRKLKNKKLFVFYYFAGGLLLLFFFYNMAFAKKSFPGSYVAGIYVGGKTPSEIAGVLKKIQPIEKIVIKNGERIYEVDIASLSLSLDPEKTAKRVFDYFRTGNPFVDIKRRLKTPITLKNFSFSLNLDENKLNETLLIISSETTTEPVYPGVYFEEGEVVINKGSKGERIDILALKAQIENKISRLDRNPIHMPKEVVDPTISEAQAEILKQRGESLLEKSISLKFEYDSFYYGGEDLLAFLKPEGKYQEEELAKVASIVSEKVNRNPQDSIFNFSEGKVVEFTPSKEGVEVDTKLLINSITDALKILENEEEGIAIEIPVNKTSPSVTNKEVNDLGINTLVGRGTSKFAGSISSRIYNIDLSSSKFDGVLIKPGEVFSFNNTVGEIDALTGYKEAYIIKDGATVLGDGGGVCQVSTTLFRAALDAGLPIVYRRAHSYRVGYYEQDGPVGYDATIYSPTTDFKFKNDTPNHLLIQTLFDSRTASLIFEIYGTDDGRTVSISKPVVWDVSPPPEDLYIDDPTKPAGQIEQIDYKAWGAKAKFNYFVERDGEVLQDTTFSSTYRSWQAKFLRGTGPVI